jgi:hypothetical protein
MREKNQKPDAAASQPAAFALLSSPDSFAMVDQLLN